MPKAVCLPVPGVLNRLTTDLTQIPARLRQGVFFNGKVEHKMEAEVSVPCDRYNWLKRVFYGTWTANTAARILSNGVPAIPSINAQPLTEVNGLGNIALSIKEAAFMTKAIGNGLALIEGVIATVDLYKSTQAYHAAEAKLSAADRASAANAEVVLNLKYREAEKRKLEQIAAYRADENSQIDTTTDQPSGCLPACPTAQRVKGKFQRRESIALDSGNGGLLHPESSLSIAREKTEIVVPDQLLTADVCDNYLSYIRALAAKEEAESGLTIDRIAWCRDFVAQGVRAGWDLTVEFLKVCAEPVGSVVSFALSLPVGIGQMVAGAVELAQARKQEARTRQAVEAADINKAKLQEAAPNESILDMEKRTKMLARFTAEDGYVQKTFDDVQRMRQERIGWFMKLKTWAKARIGYGCFSVGTALAGAVLMSLGGGAVVATGGFALLIIGATAGAIWLGFAVYKCVERNRMAQVGTREKHKLKKALRIRDKEIHGDKHVKKTFTSPKKRTLQELESLVNDPRLKSNQYLAALILAKRLMLAEKQHNAMLGAAISVTDAGAKQKRLQASTVLQTLGMSKTLTSMLKRASLDESITEIHRYLLGEVRPRIGSDNRIGT